MNESIQFGQSMLIDIVEGQPTIELLTYTHHTTLDPTVGCDCAAVEIISKGA